MFTYQYERPAVTCDIIVYCTLHPQSILLIKRKNDPFAGKYALPGGFLDMQERLQHCAARELREETGLEYYDEYFKLVSIADKIDRDPRQRTLSVIYELEVYGKEIPKAGDDAASAEWVKLRDILAGSIDLAFDHSELINQWWDYKLGLS